MRILLAATLIAVSLSAAAQSGVRAPPQGSQPLQEPPPPPVLREDASPEPVVTTRQEGDLVIQEFRVNGKLYMQRVTPKHGKPYVLMDNHGDGTFMRQDNPLDSGLRVPQWVLKEF